VVWSGKNGVALSLARAGWRGVAEGLGINVEHLRRGSIPWRWLFYGTYSALACITVSFAIASKVIGSV